MRDWLKSKQGIGIILALVWGGFLTYLLRFSPWVFREQPDGVLLGFMPVAIVVLLLVVSLALTLDKHRKEVPDELRLMTSKLFACALALVGGCSVFALIIIQRGFFTIAPIFFVGVSYFLGFRPWWRCIMWAVPIVTVIYLSFLALDLPFAPF